MVLGLEIDVLLAFIVMLGPMLTLIFSSVLQDSSTADKVGDDIKGFASKHGEYGLHLVCE
jgi:hypothetical protein